MACAGVVRAAPADDAFAAQLSALASGGFPEKSAAITALAEQRHPNTRLVLAALLEGRLYYRNADNQVFVTDGGETRLALTDPLTLKTAGDASPDDFTRITTNNSLRKA